MRRIQLMENLLLKCSLVVLLFFIADLHSQSINTLEPDSAKEKPIELRRNVESNSTFQTYEERYRDKNLIEEKKSLFPLGFEEKKLKKIERVAGIWTELNPKVPRVAYSGIQFVNKDTGWAAGDLGALIKTTDGGGSWKVIETNTTKPILKVRSYNGTTVIAGGYDGLILRSTDSGETFAQAASGVGTGVDLWGLEMINDTLGWACGATTLLQTKDGGETWKIVNTPGYTGNLWWIDFIDENYGFVAADGKVLRTTNGGSDWDIIQAGDNQPLYSIDIIDSLHIAAAGYGGTSYRGKNIYSSDGGNTWINGGHLTFEAVNCIKYVNKDTGYVILNEVGIWKTTNHGESWIGIGNIGEWEIQLLAEENIGYNVGSGLRLYKTEGNTDAWKKLIINDNFTGVYFTSETTGYSSANRIIYKTTNGGENWLVLTNFPSDVFTSALNSLTFTDSPIGYAGGPPNRIVKTTDAGNSWYITNQSGLTDTIGSINKIFFISPTTGWAVTSRGGILKTTDAGENWFAQLNAGSYVIFNSIHFIDSLYGWTANAAQWPFKTTNGGAKWIQQTSLNIFNTRDIYFIDSLIGFTIKFLELCKTTNSGDSWFTQFNSQNAILSFSWLSPTHGFIIGEGVYETNDSGNTWLEIVDLRKIGLKKFHSPTNYIGYSIGSLGVVLKYEDTTYLPVPVLTATVNAINFGTIKIGTTKEDSVLVSNTGASTLHVSGIISSNQHFSFPRDTLTLATSEETYLKITFIPVDTSVQSGYIIITSNALSSPDTITVQGKGTDIVAVEDKMKNPLNYRLNQNYPNPFNPTTHITFEIPKQSEIKIILYDITGQEVKILVDQNLEAGYYSVTLNAKEYNSGIYFCRMTTSGGDMAVKKLTIIK